MKIIHLREKCIGCGACVSVCPEFFKADDEGKTVLAKDEAKYDAEKSKGVLEIESAGCIEEAAGVCPVQCIKIKR